MKTDDLVAVVPEELAGLVGTLADLLHEELVEGVTVFTLLLFYFRSLLYMDCCSIPEGWMKKLWVSCYFSTWETVRS
jgi:hypothetical protein